MKLVGVLTGCVDAVTALVARPKTVWECGKEGNRQGSPLLLQKPQCRHRRIEAYNARCHFSGRKAKA